MTPPTTRTSRRWVVQGLPSLPFPSLHGQRWALQGGGSCSRWKHLWRLPGGKPCLMVLQGAVEGRPPKVLRLPRGWKLLTSPFSTGLGAGSVLVLRGPFKRNHSSIPGGIAGVPVSFGKLAWQLPVSRHKEKPLFWSAANKGSHMESCCLKRCVHGRRRSQEIQPLFFPPARRNPCSLSGLSGWNPLLRALEGADPERGLPLIP